MDITKSWYDPFPAEPGETRTLGEFQFKFHKPSENSNEHQFLIKYTGTFYIPKNHYKFYDYRVRGRIEYSGKVKDEWICVGNAFSLGSIEKERKNLTYGEVNRVFFSGAMKDILLPLLKEDRKKWMQERNKIKKQELAKNAKEKGISEQELKSLETKKKQADKEMLRTQELMRVLPVVRRIKDLAENLLANASKDGYSKESARKLRYATDSLSGDTYTKLLKNGTGK